MADGNSRTGAASREVPPTPQPVRQAELLVRRLQARIVKAHAAGRWNPESFRDNACSRTRTAAAFWPWNECATTTVRTRPAWTGKPD